MIRFYIFLFSILPATLNLYGQSELKTKRSTELPAQRTCATEHPPEEFEHWMSRARAMNIGLSDHEFNIPVIIHIVHNGQAVGVDENITYQQAMSQLDVLNEDFNRLNADTTFTPDGFKPVAGKLKITFCPAVVDPSGTILPEPGVNRIRRQDLGFIPPPFQKSYVDTLVKPKTIWAPGEYLNLWVMKLSGDILGFATFPNPLNTGIPGIPPGTYGTSIQDGVVIHYQVFGRVGNVAYPYNLGRTCTHEVGHWLGLKHVWGDGLANGCLSDDYCDDTPNQELPTPDFMACPAFPTISCNNGPFGNMFMNYMDYSDDGCMNILTKDQVSRMEAVLLNSAMRVSLTQSPRCNIPSAKDAKMEIFRPVSGDSLCAATFQPQVKVRNNGSEVLTSFTIEYRINDGALQYYDWTGSIAFGKTAVVTLPEVDIGAAGSYTLQATLTQPNGGADASPADNTAAVDFNRVSPLPVVATLPFTEGFQSTLFPPSGWKYDFPNPDYRWRRTTVAGGFGQSTASIRMDNYSSPDDITGQKDILLLPAFDFTAEDASLIMRFDVAYARYDQTTNDALNIYSSTDCGLTWVKHYAKSGQQLATGPDTGENPFVPNASQWRKDSVNLSSVAGLSPVLLRIENVSEWGNYLYLDNIQVYSDQNPVGISDRFATDLTLDVSPNPGNGVFNLTFSSERPGYFNLYVNNLLGQQLMSRTIGWVNAGHREQVDLSKYSKGVYLISIEKEGQRLTRKVVIE